MSSKKCPKCGNTNESPAKECDSCGSRLGGEPDYFAESVGKATIGLGAIILWITGTAISLFILYQFYSCSPVPDLL